MYSTRYKCISLILVIITTKCNANDILGCGGFVKSHVTLDFSKIEVGLYTKEGSLKEKTECAPTNGYYFLPLYEKGDYVLKVHPPAGWSFEPSEVELSVDGVSDKCSTGQDVNFSFNGFGITGRVITAGQSQGPSGVSVQLVDNSGAVRDTITTVGGDFHFTPVIPGKYTLKALHPRWKLEPSQAVVQVKEGNTALPVGVLSVKGYDVSGSISSFGSPISGVYVLLYSKEENPKFRVEGCNTALLQGVPDSPICHVKTDANGEFSFGLVPAGEYWLMALPTAPGQVAVTYNVKPQTVPFTVRHGSIYVKNAFEVTGFTVVGSVISSPGKGLSGVRVLLDEQAVGKSDAAGKFTLTKLHPGTYTVTFQHDECEIPPVELSVEASGPARGLEARAASWRVCGAVTPAGAWRLQLVGDTRRSLTTDGTDGKWCTFLPSGVYTAKVEVTAQEQRDGLQFYPLSQKVSVAHGPVADVNFSQLKATLSGRVECKTEADCQDIPVTLKYISPDGEYVSQPLVAIAKKGSYQFPSVLPGTVEVSVPAARLCWAERARRVLVSRAEVPVPAFSHTGYRLHVLASHDVEVEYSQGSWRGSWSLAAGRSARCAAARGPLQLVPRGCHIFKDPIITVDITGDDVPTASIVAVSHAAGVRVTAPAAVADLALTLACGARRDTTPPLPPARDQGAYVYEYTAYLAEGASCSVTASSSQLLFSPAVGSLRGSSRCQPAALTLRARTALTLQGKLTPPVEGATVTLTSDEATLSMVTGADGAYRFGPLDASLAYGVAAHKESYVFAEPDARGDIAAHRLAEIRVDLLDHADDAPLQGGLVSVSGGSYRRNAASGPDGRLRFTALQPAQYYIKPHMKEYRFAPASHLLQVSDGLTHNVTLRGTRVSWSCSGRAVSLSGAPAPGLTLLAAPDAGSPATCVLEEGNTDAQGNYRIRGLLPECIYTLQLKESSSPELTGLRLIKAPGKIDVSRRADAVAHVVAAWARALTSGSLRVRAPPALYRTLALTLAPAAAPHHHIMKVDKIDAHGLSALRNPGVMLALPRLPADNKSYVLALDSSLSRATHSYGEHLYYFNSDGGYKHFTVEFDPKPLAGEQELSSSSLALLPLLALVAAAVALRDKLPRLRPAVTPRQSGGKKKTG